MNTSPCEYMVLLGIAFAVSVVGGVVGYAIVELMRNW